MTFKIAVLAATSASVLIICADNDNGDPYIYEGICWRCHGEQVSSDSDTTCLRCGEIVNYTQHQTPVN